MLYAQSNDILRYSFFFQNTWKFYKLHYHTHFDVPFNMTMESPNTRIISYETNDQISISRNGYSITDDRISLVIFAFIRELISFTNKHYSEKVSVHVKWMCGTVIVP